MRALLVVDMLEDFVAAGGSLYCGESAERIVPFIEEKIREYLAGGDLVVFICDNHAPDDREFSRFPRHCVKGTPGAQVIERLRLAAANGGGKVYTVSKQRYSGFYGTDLERILKENRVDQVGVVGVCTNICVLYTVEELCNRDYDVVVYRRGVASFDEEAHNFALKQMASVLGARIED